MSSPNINNLMLIGGILAYVSIIFLGIDMAIAPKDTLAWMCKVINKLPLAWSFIRWIFDNIH